MCYATKVILQECVCISKSNCALALKWENNATTPIYLPHKSFWSLSLGVVSLGTPVLSSVQL